MKIGLVLPDIPAYSETFFTNKIKGLQSHGHEVILFTQGRGQHIFEGTKVVPAPKFAKNPVKLVWQLVLLVLFHGKTLLRFYRLERKDGIPVQAVLKRMVTNMHLLSQKLDWLHFGFGTMALQRENTAAAIQANMAVSFRGFDYYVYPVKNPDCYSILFSKKVRYHVLSEAMKKGLMKHGITDSDSIKITPAIDVSQFAEKEKQQPQKEMKIATVARLHWIKGLEYTLEALALVKQKNIPFHYTVVGDGPEKERLLFAAHQLGLADDITFTGKLPPEEVKEVLATAHVCLQYSIQEGFCNAVLEAQAMGKLCIVSDADGLIENVVDGVTGFVVPKRNPISLADKIEAVSNMPDPEKDRMVQKATERISAAFNLPGQIQQFITFYHKKE